jgi:hypothetical protein
VRRHLFLLVLLTLLVAPLGSRCGAGQLPTAPGDEPATAQRDEGEEPTAAPTSESRREEEVYTMDVRPVPGTVEPGLERLVERAKEDLAQTLSVPVEEVKVLEAKSVVWPDASLGCPQPGMRYRQVPMDGARILLTVDGQTYAYHSGGGRDPFLCEQITKVTRGTPEPLELIPPSGSESD